MSTAAGFILLFLGLQAAFIWARYAVFRIDGPATPGVRVIEVSTVSSMALGFWLIASRTAGPSALDAAALGLASASAALFFWAVRGVRRHQLSAAFSTDLPTELLRSGAFRFVRNPFYLAYLLAHAVPFAASRSAWALLPLAWMALLYRRAVRMEERKFLESPLAAQWQRYAQVTGRFLPRLPVGRRSRKSRESLT
jgi:protein-S-isoprenylcysteine O-methyltransferase Ste14